jgi:hypothetical protein
MEVIFMDEVLVKAVLNFGVFPAITIYLIFIIIKDFKADMTKLKTDTETYYKEILKQYNETNKLLAELVQINEQMQNYNMTYMNNLLIKLLDVLEDYHKD